MADLSVTTQQRTNLQPGRPWSNFFSHIHLTNIYLEGLANKAVITSTVYVSPNNFYVSFTVLTNITFWIKLQQLLISKIYLWKNIVSKIWLFVFLYTKESLEFLEDFTLLKKQTVIQ